jgi:two-component system, OmpR family, sensor histidine kinase KdpD
MSGNLLLRNRATRFAAALTGGLLVALVLVAVDADLAAAAIVLMLAVVGASLLGYGVGLAVALEAFVFLIYLFAPPKDSFAIHEVDDVVALVAFVAVSVIVGAVVARLNDLRERAALAAHEAEVRVEATSGLLAGADASDVAEIVCRELVDLFDLTSCELALTDHPPVLKVRFGRQLQPYEQTTLDALESALTVAFDRARLDAEAREHRVAAEVDRSRASFLAAITHDLRTPLATIKTATASLLASGDSMASEDRRDLIDASYQEAARLEQLVTIALEITRIRSGGLRPEPVAVSLGDLVRAATQRLRPLSSDRHIALDVSPELPAAYVDSMLLERSVANVLENALLHSPADRGIEVTAACSGRMVELRIADHGDGIASADRERVFDEFVQLDRRGTSAGVGLGLAITRAFVVANGGSVRCEETPGGGATFVLTMPAEPEDAP